MDLLRDGRHRRPRPEAQRDQWGPQAERKRSEHRRVIDEDGVVGEGRAAARARRETDHREQVRTSARDQLDLLTELDRVTEAAGDRTAQALVHRHLRGASREWEPPGDDRDAAQRGTRVLKTDQRDGGTLEAASCRTAWTTPGRSDSVVICEGASPDALSTRTSSDEAPACCNWASPAWTVSPWIAIWTASTTAMPSATALAVRVLRSGRARMARVARSRKSLTGPAWRASPPGRSRPGSHPAPARRGSGRHRRPPHRRA